ncbi:hypothetical protein TNCV_736241 [Trichonephila clavipes]|nr:hypothetical protein TNCV_736241 [Trichonephila clavipes]
MLIVYEDVDCNGHAAVWLYQERYPNRHVSYYTTFTSVSRRLRDSGSGHIKSLVYRTSVPSTEDLIPQTYVDSWRKNDMSGIFQCINQYGGYDPRLVTEWVRVESRVRLGCIFLGKDVGLSPEMDSSLERKSSAPHLVICWDPHL